MAKLVASTYGDALFELAVETGQVEGLFAEAKGISGILQENADFTRLMNHPKIVKEEKIKLLEEAFKGRVSNEMLGLMTMLISKNHYSDMEAVFDYFVERIKEYKKIGTAYVTAAMPLTESQKEQIEKKLLDTTDYVSFEMHYVVDKELIGGLVIRIGDRVVDSSIQTKLRKLTGELSKIQLKVGECAP